MEYGTFLDQARWENERGCYKEAVAVAVVVGGGGAGDVGRFLRKDEWFRRPGLKSEGEEELSKSSKKCWKDGVR